MTEARQLVLWESPFCDSCLANDRCFERWTELGCSPGFEPTTPTGSYMLHPALPDFLPRIAECNGLDFDIVARRQQLPLLPPYILQIRRWSRIESLHGIPAVAVPLREVERLAKAANRQGCDAKAMLGLTNEQVLLVTGFAHDRFLEQVWTLPRRARLLSAIRAIGADVAIAWGYSVWHRDADGRRTPRIEHLYNLRRSILAYAALQELSIPVIPNVYWGLPEDLAIWSDWLAQNPYVSTIAMDLQTVDTEADWKEVVNDIRYFQRLLPREIHCVFSGICQAHRVRTIREVWPSSSVSNCGPFFCVAFPEKTLFGLQPRPGHRAGWSYTRIFHDRVEQYVELMNGGDPACSSHAAAWGKPEKVSDPSRARKRLATSVSNGQLPLLALAPWSRNSQASEDSRDGR